MNDNYAFDDCSILNMCSVEIPSSFWEIFKSKTLSSPYCKNLNTLFNYLKNNDQPVYKFVPSNFDKRIIKVIKDLLAKKEINPLMIRPLNARMIDQFNEFKNKINNEFQEIEKSEDVSQLRQLFKDNEIQLKKDDNIPEDEDFMIMKGYEEFSSTKNKIIISMDQHFWSYKELIKNNLNIIVVPEWDCCKFIP